MKSWIALIVAMLAVLVLAACNDDDAKVASYNISKAADNFEIGRRIVFYNGITDEYMLTIEGRCSLDLSRARVLAVTCETAQSEYKKHYLGLSDNVTYFAEQLEPADVNVYHYRVTFKPQTIIPDVRIRADASEIPLPQVKE